MLRVFLSSVVVVGLFLTARPAAAQEALDAIASDAAVVIRIKAPKTTTEKVAAFAGAIDPDLEMQVEGFAPGIGQLIKNQTLDGVNQAADWWIGVYAPEDEGEPPTMVFVIPGTDLEKMEEAVGDDYTFIKHGKFGVYTDDEDLAKETEALIKKKSGSIAKSIDASAKGLFDKGDISAFVNLGGLVEKFGDKLDEAEEKAKEALENAPAGPNSEQAQKLAATFLPHIFQGMKDSQSFTVALTVSKSGVNLEELLRVKSGSDFDKLLQKSPPSAMENLGSLPASSQWYFGVALDMKALLEFSAEAVEAVGDEKTQKALQESLEELKKLKYGPSVGALKIQEGKEGEGVLTAVQISEISPTDKFRDINRKTAKATAEGVEQNGFKQTTKIEADKETFGSSKADVLTMKFEPAQDADPSVSAMVNTFIGTAFGEEGITQRIVYLKDRVVQTVGGGKDLMQKTLSSVEKKGTASKAVAAAQGTFGKSNVLLLIDLPNTAIHVGRILAKSEQLGALIPPGIFDGLESSESYMTIAAGTEPQGLRISTTVPIQQIVGIKKIVDSASGNKAEK